MLIIESEYQNFLIVNFLGSQRTTLMFITAWLWLHNAVLKECVCVCVMRKC